MTLEELKELLKGRVELAQLNARNEALTKKRRTFHEGKADAYADILWLIEIYERVQKEEN